MRKALVFLLLFAQCHWGTGSKAVNLQPQKSGITTVKFHDAERNRPLITEVWYPVDDQANAIPVKGMWVRCPEARDAPLKSGKYPLVVMSHDNGGVRLNVAWLAEILAANGFIVAAMDHHGNTWNNKIAENFVKIWERPKDVSCVIDRLLADSKFGASIDSKRIGFIGYSLGGQTGVWIAGGKINHFEEVPMEEIPEGQMPNIVTKELLDSIDFAPVRESYRDPRVAALFLMAPALGYLFDMNSLQSIEVPVYIVAPEADQVVPPENNGKLLASKIQKAVFTLIPGSASHYVFLNEASKGGSLMLNRTVVQDPPSVDRKKIHQDIGLAAIQFFRTHLK